METRVGHASTHEPAFSASDSDGTLDGKGHGRNSLSGRQPEISSPSWKIALLNFGPSWFAVTQCTGVVALILNRLPYNGQWLYWLSVIVFALDLILFTIFTLIMGLRFLIFRRLFVSTMSDNTEPMFFACFPMTLATLTQLICYVCFPAWGSWVADLAWALWWIDVVLSATCCLVLPYLSFHVHEIKAANITAIWLVPVISCVVCAASGGTVATILNTPQHALWTILISYVLLGMGLMLSFTIITIYYFRLMIYNNPPQESIFSVFLPLGPLGQGGFAFQQLGQDSLKIFPLTNTLNDTAGQIFYAGGYLVALLMWGFGLAWLFFAIASISRGRNPFNMTWWSSIFPMGVYTMSTIQMGRELPSSFFKVLGTIFAVATTLFWLFVSTKTLQYSLNGALFFSPPQFHCRTRPIFQKTRDRQQADDTASGS